MSLTKKEACVVCNKKTTIQCRCQQYTCLSHRFADQHKCSFDFRQHHKDVIKEQLPKVVRDKVIKI